MGIILKGEKSLEGKIKRKKDAREKLQKELKENKKELWSLRKKYLTLKLTAILNAENKNNREKTFEKINQYVKKVDNTRGKINKLDEEIAGLIKGHQGEEHITQVLKSQLDDNYYILNGKKFEAKNKNSSGSKKAEIDHIIVGPRGIICIEVKNMSGRFYYEGNGGEEGWLKAPFSSKNSLKVPMPSPLKQIERSTHLLKDFIEEKITANHISDNEIADELNFYPLVVFTNDKCILHGVKNRLNMPTPLLLKDELINYIETLPKDPYLKEEKRARELAYSLVETS